MTKSEQRDCDAWLSLVSRRCDMVTGETLLTILERIESSGMRSVNGSIRQLCERWRSGCCAVRAARLILADDALAAESQS